MIPAARRVTSSSLTVVRNGQGRQVSRNACGARTGSGVNNVTVAQLGGRHPQTRGFSQTAPSRSALDFALKPKEGDILKAEAKNEDPLGRPEHAVISTFDLFSIGGPYSCHAYLSFQTHVMLFQLVRAVRILLAL